MDVLEYLYSDAGAYFPYIDIEECRNMLMAVAVRILYKSRVDENTAFGIVRERLGNAPETLYLYLADYDEYARMATPQGFTPVNAVQILKKYGIEAKGWINEERHISYLVVHNFSSSLSKQLVAVFPQMTPWRFRTKPLTDWEKQFLIALLADDATARSMVEEYCVTNRVQEQARGAQLDQLIADLLKIKLADAIGRERDWLSTIRSLEAQLQNAYQNYDEVCATIVGIKANHSEDGCMDFKNALLTNPNCHLTEVYQSNVSFFLTGFVTNFSEHKLESIIAHDRSHMFDYATELGCSVQQLRTLYRELFMGKRYRLNVFGGFSVDLAHNTVTLLSRSSDLSVSRNAMPNPHIYYYACQGGFAQDYRKAFADRDYADILATAASEVSNINWTDISPVSNLVEDLCCRCAQVPCVWDKQAKEFITPRELAERVRANGQ